MKRSFSSLVADGSLSGSNCHCPPEFCWLDFRAWKGSQASSKIRGLPGTRLIVSVPGERPVLLGFADRLAESPETPERSTVKQS